MKKYIKKIIMISILIFSSSDLCFGKNVSKHDATMVANNWIDTIIRLKGSWGEYPDASIREIKEISYGSRKIGYYCSVDPVGFIIIPRLHELAPVNAYSETSNLDPEKDKGLAQLIKGKMLDTLRTIEKHCGPIDSVQTANVESLLKFNHRKSWDQLVQPASAFAAEIESNIVGMNYAGGNPPLLSSSWDQQSPYNDLCPPGANSSLTLVGCVATAGAQVMRYYAWPPYGVSHNSYEWDGDDSCSGISTGGSTQSATFSDTYDWKSMCNRYVWDVLDGRWEDENWDPLTQSNLDAVAELCYEVGVSVEMDYGVCRSGAYIAQWGEPDLGEAFKAFFRYNQDIESKDREDCSADEWWQYIVNNLSHNRPLVFQCRTTTDCVEYGLHAIVCDGWQIIGTARQYHMNYGWDDWAPPCAPEWSGHTHSNAWFTFNGLPASTKDDEKMLIKIKPDVGLGPKLSYGTYWKNSFPYRYFEQDCTTDQNTTFSAGQNLQFLPGITVASPIGYYIQFNGSSGNSTRLFSIKGTSTGGSFATVRIYNGEIRMQNNGGIRFH